MAPAITEPVAEVSTGTDGTSFSVGPFTPTANALLTVIVFASDTTAAGSMSGGGLSWSKVGSATYNSGASTMYLFQAIVSSSPSSMTITFDCTGDTATGCDIIVHQSTDYDTGTPIRQYKFAADAASDNVNWTLDSALLTTNGYIAGVTMINDRLGWAEGDLSPGGFTLTASSGHNAPSVDSGGAYRVNGLTTSNPFWLTADVVDCGGIFIEINASSGMVTHEIVVSDSASESDAVARRADGKRSTSDTTLLSDAISRLANGNRALSDTVLIDDLAAALAALVVQALDNWGLSETVARLANANRNPFDAIAPTETFARQADASRQVSESLPYVDEFVRQANAFRDGISDTLGVSDIAYAAINTVGVMIQELLATADSSATQMTAKRSLSDSLAYFENIAAFITGLRVIDDVAVISDSVGMSAIFAAAISDAIGVEAETVQRIFRLLRTVNDSIGAIDSTGIATRFVRAYSDRLAHRDSFAQQMTFHRAAQEAFAGTDFVERRADAKRTAADTLAGRDAFGSGSSYQRTASDTVGMADAVRRLARAARAFSDSLGISDLVGVASRFKAAITDALGLNADASLLMIRSRAISETMALAEAFVRQADANRTLQDVLGLSESLGKFITSLREISDTYGLADALRSLTQVKRTASDSILLSESADRTVEYRRSIAEPIGVQEELAKIAEIMRSIQENIGLPDSTAILLHEAVIHIWEALLETRIYTGSYDMVMAPEVYEKQPGESDSYAFEFEDKLSSGETLSSGATVTATPAGLTISGVTISGTQVQCAIAGGTDGTRYALEASAVTSLSQTVQVDGVLLVRRGAK